MKCALKAEFADLICRSDSLEATFSVLEKVCILIFITEIHIRLEEQVELNHKRRRYVYEMYMNGPCDRHDMRNIFRILKAEFQSFCVNKNNLWHHFIACRHWYMCGLLKNVCLTICVRAEVSRLSLSRWFPHFLSFIQSSLWSVEFSSEIVTVHRQHHFD